MTLASILLVLGYFLEDLGRLIFSLSFFNNISSYA